MILCQIGELTRNKNKQVVNPFPEGKALMLKFQELVKYFIQAKVHRHNYDIILEHSPENPKTKIERDLNSINPNKVLNIRFCILSSRISNSPRVELIGQS